MWDVDKENRVDLIEYIKKRKHCRRGKNIYDAQGGKIYHYWEEKN